ncbi:MAG: DUF3347 domain-containing protein [Myxococcales bacterium]|nr:DUF3347 domain-containing protein [Myxococcales bacterium]
MSRAFAVFFAISLLLAACGSKGEGGSSSAKAETAAAEAPTQPLALPETGTVPKPEVFEDIVESYLAIGARLVADDGAGAAKAFGALGGMLASVSEGVLADLKVRSAVLDASNSANIEEQRWVFEGLSRALDALLEEGGNPTGRALHRAHCPMAFKNRGAIWIQSEETIANPYYGASMLKCGSLRKTFEPKAEEDVEAAKTAE